MGAGAIGSLYGGLLSLKYPGSVTLVGRNPLVASVNEGGLILEGVMGEYTIAVRAIEDPSTIKKADYVFITTKTYDTLTAAQSVKHLIDAGAYVIIVQNGIGTELALAEALNTTRVIRATTCMGALMVSPGIVNATGRGITELGSRYPENMETVYKIADLLQDAGFDVRTSENIEGVVWTKTIVNCGINPIGALTGMTNGEIHGNPILRELVIRLVQETAAVADALGIELTTDDPVRYTLGTAEATSENTNSMLQDILARKRTEIDAITGAVIRIANELGLNAPVSQTVFALVKAIESRYTDDGSVTDEAIIMAVEELLKAINQH